MKRFVSMLLCTAMILGMFAGCGGEEKTSNEVTAFSVGYAKANINPSDPVPLRGYGDAMERFSTGILEPLYATCVAFADTEGEVVLLISTDLANSFTNMTEDARNRISEATGVPVSHVLFTASHSHSSPDIMQTSAASIITYTEFVIEQFVQGAKDAIADLAPATMETGYNRVDGINTVRHYLLSDGTYQGKSVGTLAKDALIGHATKVDNLLQVVKFTREGDKKPVVLVNWCGHPGNISDDIYTLASSHYVGVLRSQLEEKYGCEVSYVLSGSGNVNNASQIPGEVAHKDYKELGTRLANEVSTILDSKLTASKVDKIHLSENLWTAADKTNLNQTLPLYAFSIGDWACVTAPFEIFDTNAMAVRDASKFKMTFYASCANESYGYLPTPASYDWAITYEAPISKFPKGTAEALQAELIRQLDEIFVASSNEIVDKGEGYNTPEFVPTSDGITYINTTPGELNNCMAVENGFYAIGLFAENSANAKTMLCIDKATAEAVLAKESMKLLFNESHVIVGIAE